MNQGKEASLVQREVAANAAGGIDEVPPLATCAPALSSRTQAGCVRSGEERREIDGEA